MIMNNGLFLFYYASFIVLLYIDEKTKCVGAITFLKYAKKYVASQAKQNKSRSV